MDNDEDLASRTEFVLNTKDWLAFLAALDRPPRKIEKLRRLLGEPSPFESGNRNRSARSGG